MIEVNTEIILNNNILDITKQLEARITYLMDRFSVLEEEVAIAITSDNEDLDDIRSVDTRNKLDELVTIFMELKPIERLIRFKYKEFNALFDKLSQIENEKLYGKFFSFLSCVSARKYTKKNIFIQRSLTGNASLE